MRSHLSILFLLLLAPAVRGAVQGGSADTELAPAQEPQELGEAPQKQPATEDEAPGLPRTPAEWLERAEQLATAIEADERKPEQAEKLYAQLEAVLRRELDGNRGAFRGARRATDPITRPALAEGEAELDVGETVADLYDSLGTLYLARLRLMEVVTPRFRGRLTGNGVTGVSQFWMEVDFVKRIVRYQRIAVPDGLRQVGRNLRAAPVPTILGGLLVLAAFSVFLRWRKWAATGIPRLRDLTRRAWRSHAAAQPFASFLRFLELTRRPLEWLTLALVVFSLADVPEMQELEDVLRVIVFSMLLTWLAVSVADAVATPEGTTRSEARARARLYSLWIVAAWAVVLGLGLRLTEILTGQGTLHAWVWHLFELLAVPVAVLLLIVWRPIIQRKLAREAHFSAWVAALLERRGKLGDLLATVGGLGYLLALGARRQALKIVRRSALGRTLVAEALRQSMTRAGEDGTQDAQPQGVDAETRKRWLHGDTVVESALSDELEEVLDRLDRGWRSVALIGERGGGKSFLLRRLAAAKEGKALIVSCPHGGADKAYAAFLRALGFEASEPTTEEVNEALRSRDIQLVAWDDLQRLCRPSLGGQDQLDRLLELIDPWRDLPLVAAIDSAAWEYLGRLREATIPGASTVLLSAWTEGQIGELLESRAREVGVELDYSRLRFPRLLLEHDFDSPEEGLRASYRRILWAEADGNPEVALRLVVDHMLEKEDGDALLLLPRTTTAAELEGMTLVERLVLRFIVQTDGATPEEIQAGLRYPPAVITTAVSAATMRGVLDENHGRYRVAWKWYRTVTRILTRRNMLGAAQQKSERGPASPRAGRPQARVPAMRGARWS